MFSASTVLTQLLAMTKGKGCGGLEVLPSLLLPTSQTLFLGSVGELCVGCGRMDRGNYSDAVTGRNWKKRRQCTGDPSVTCMLM